MNLQPTHLCCCLIFYEGLHSQKTKAAIPYGIAALKPFLNPKLNSDYVVRQLVFLLAKNNNSCAEHNTKCCYACNGVNTGVGVLVVLIA